MSNNRLLPVIIKVRPQRQRRARSHGKPPPFEPKKEEGFEWVKALKTTREIVAACRRQLTYERHVTLTASISRGAIVCHAMELELIPRGGLKQWIERNFTDWSVSQARLDRTLYLNRARLESAALMMPNNAQALKAAGVKRPYGVVAQRALALKFYDLVEKHKADGASHQAAVDAAIEKAKPKRRPKDEGIPLETKVIMQMWFGTMDPRHIEERGFRCPNDLYKWYEKVKQDHDQFAQWAEQANAHWYGKSNPDGNER